MIGVIEESQVGCRPELADSYLDRNDRLEILRQAQTQNCYEVVSATGSATA